jgi:hypothetical protein
MASPIDPTILQWLLENLWAPFLAVVSVWWGMLQHRITKIEKVAEAAVDRPEFTGYSGRTDKRLDNLHDDIKQVHELFRQHNEQDRLRHDSLVSLIHTNHSQILNHMIDRKG